MIVTDQEFKQMPLKDLKKRLHHALNNRDQLDHYITAIEEEIDKRERVS